MALGTLAASAGNRTNRHFENKVKFYKKNIKMFEQLIVFDLKLFITTGHGGHSVGTGPRADRLTLKGKGPVHRSSERHKAHIMLH